MWVGETYTRKLIYKVVSGIIKIVRGKKDGKMKQFVGKMEENVKGKIGKVGLEKVCVAA
jgi:hypothetical protein